MDKLMFEFCEMPAEFDYNVALRFNEVDKVFYFYYRKLADAKASAELPVIMKALVIDNPMIQMLINGMLEQFGNELTASQPEASSATPQIEQAGTDSRNKEGSS